MMAGGHPLHDEQRWPWLKAVAAEALRQIGEGALAVVVACSALKRRYRDLLRAELGPIFFIHLDGDPALLRARMEMRRHHFMPVSLLDSQRATLEPLAPDEDGVVLDIALSKEALVKAALAALHAQGESVAS